MQQLAGGGGRVGLLGVSPMTRRCAVCGRRQSAVADRQPYAGDRAGTGGHGVCQALSLEDFRARPPALRVLVLATGGGEPVLDAATLARLGQPSDGAAADRFRRAAEC
jgi:hypothetical protein